MVYAKYLTINKVVPFMHNIVGRAENHYVAVRSPGIDNILSSANIIRGVVEHHNIVAVHLIVLEDNCVDIIIVF